MLTAGVRNYSILTGDGDLWMLDCEAIDPELTGRIVTAEGTLVGLDRLKLDWIGAVSP